MVLHSAPLSLRVYACSLATRPPPSGGYPLQGSGKRWPRTSVTKHGLRSTCAENKEGTLIFWAHLLSTHIALKSNTSICVIKGKKTNHPVLSASFRFWALESCSLLSFFLLDGAVLGGSTEMILLMDVCGERTIRRPGPWLHDTKYSSVLKWAEGAEICEWKNLRCCLHPFAWRTGSASPLPESTPRARLGPLSQQVPRKEGPTPAVRWSSLVPG